MEESFPFASSTEVTKTQHILISPSYTWNQLLSILKEKFAFQNVKSLELFSLETQEAIGERIIDMDDFWGTSKYFSDHMVFKVFGSNESSLGSVSASNIASLLPDVTESYDYNNISSHFSSYASLSKSIDSPKEYNFNDTKVESPKKEKDVEREIISQESLSYSTSIQLTQLTTSSSAYSDVTTSFDFEKTPLSVTSEVEGLEKMFTTLFSNLSSLKSPDEVQETKLTYPSTSMAHLKTSAELEAEALQKEKLLREQAKDAETKRLVELYEKEREIYRSHSDPALDQYQFTASKHAVPSHAESLSSFENENSNRIAKEKLAAQERRRQEILSLQAAAVNKKPTPIDDEDDKHWSKMEEEKAIRKAMEIEQNKRLQSKSRFISGSSSGSTSKDSLVSINMTSIHNTTERILCKIPENCNWSELKEYISHFFKLDSPDAVKNLILIDEEGEIASGEISDDIKFWKFYSRRYLLTEGMAFQVTHDPRTVKHAVVHEVSKQNGSLDKLTFKLPGNSEPVKISVKENSSWDDLLSILRASLSIPSNFSISTLSLVDEDGDLIAGNIAEINKFWKIVKTRYVDGNAVFDVNIEKSEPQVVDRKQQVNSSVIAKQTAVEPPQNAKDSLKKEVTIWCCNKETDFGSKVEARVELTENWMDICSSILQSLGLSIESHIIEMIDLVDTEGDDVFSGITTSQKFWKAFNNRYSHHEMVFVITIMKLQKNFQSEIAGVPLLFRLNTQPDQPKQEIKIPKDAKWDNISIAILQQLKLQDKFSVHHIDLIDDEGDEVLSAITSEQKFWKAVNSRYNSSDMSFVLSLIEKPQLPPPKPQPSLPQSVPSFTISCRHASGSLPIETLIPQNGNWTEICETIVQSLKLTNHSVENIDLIDNDGDAVFASIATESKFWKAAKSRYKHGEMVFVVTTSHQAPALPTTRILCKLATDKPGTKHEVPVVIDGDWERVKQDILLAFKLQEVCDVEHVDLIDDDGDEVLGKIVTTSKFWKAVNSRYNQENMVFVVHVNKKNHVEIPQTNHQPLPPTVSFLCRLSSQGQEYNTFLAVYENSEWEQVCAVISSLYQIYPPYFVDFIELVDNENDSLLSKVCNTQKFWKVISRHNPDENVVVIHIGQDASLTYDASTYNYGVDVPMPQPDSSNSYLSSDNLQSTSLHYNNYTPTNRPMNEYTYSSNASNYNSWNDNSRFDDRSDHTDTISESSNSYYQQQPNQNPKGFDRPTNPAIQTKNISQKIDNAVDIFLRAVSNNDLNAVASIVRSGIDINIKDDVGIAALHIAATNGYMDLVKYLTDNNANISCRDFDGTTPLHNACENGHVDVALYLVRNGADTSLRNKAGLTSLHYVCMNGCMPLTVLIRDYMINVATSVGLTLLHCAADMGHYDMCQYLLEHSAQVHPRDDEGMTPLHLAAIGGHSDIVDLLITYKAYYNTRDDLGMSPLHYACREGHLDTVVLLLRYGANAFARNNNYDSTLHLACECGSLDIAKLLLEKKVEINCRNNRGETPLEVASANGHDDLINWLESRRATMRPESTVEAHTRQQVDLKSESAIRAFEAEEERTYGFDPSQQNNVQSNPTSYYAPPATRGPVKGTKE